MSAMQLVTSWLGRVRWLIGLDLPRAVSVGHALGEGQGAAVDLSQVFGLTRPPLAARVVEVKVAARRLHLVLGEAASICAVSSSDLHAAPRSLRGAMAKLGLIGLCFSARESSFGYLLDRQRVASRVHA